MFFPWCFSHDGPWRWDLYNCLDLELKGGVYGVRFAPLFGTGRDLARRYFGLFVSWWYLWVDDRRWMGSLLTDGLFKSACGELLAGWPCALIYTQPAVPW